MDLNKTIHIATAPSCKSRQWQNNIVTVSAFVKKLKQPAAINMTIAEYMKLDKQEQLRYKDVGGFVGGELNGTQRKAGTVAGRDLIALDFDNLQRGAAEIIKGKIKVAYNYAAVMYSTAKHTDAAPRLRIIIFLDRTVTAEEYEPIARYIAQQLGIEGADKTTYQAERMMFWAACCTDGRFFFYDNTTQGNAVNADSVLSSYSDWRNPGEWARAAAEDIPKPFKLQQAKLTDPREKTGIVGTFCRAYSITGAIDSFLSDIYIPFEGSGNRYTYTAGSSAGGAIVYDNDVHLYSNHSTDPANTGSCVNAWDLVRLHKYGALDSESKPGTPVNKLPSFAAMCALANADELVKRQIAIDDFGGQEYGGVTDAAKMELVSLNGKQLNAETLSQLLQCLNISIRYNQISHDIDITGLPREYSEEQANNILPVYLYDRAKAIGLKGLSREAIPQYLAVIADKCRYNPVTEQLDAIAWDGTDRFGEICDVLGISRSGLYASFVRKWLIGCTIIARNNGRQSLEGVLTLQGPQGCGKTSFFRGLFPPPFDKYFKEGASLDINRTDSIAQNVTFWCVELGELDSTLSREQSALKAFLTNTRDEYRAPYARAAVKHPRRTAFCGSVNDERFLRDPTGNRRFWVVPVQRIDLDKMAKLDKSFFMQLWAQANLEGKANTNAHRLTAIENKQLEKSNSAHTEMLPGEGELLSLFNYDIPAAVWGDYTAGDLINHSVYGQTLRRYGANRIGRALSHIAANDTRILKRTLHGQVVYKLPLPAASVIDFGEVAGSKKA